jgi:peptidoglycan DL-endopeptidase CwlO
VMVAYAQIGISLPHSSQAQYGLGVPVPRDQLEAGDLVFFDGLDHVGIYIGGGQIVHAPHTGDVVRIASLASFGSRYVGARRV